MLPERATSAVVVAGMHRSGTSLVTRLVSLWGLQLPVDDIGARRGNERGHWESRSVIELNEWLLAQSGSTWFDTMIPDRLEISPEVVQRFDRALAAGFDPSGSMIIKDPRITKMTRTWVQALRAMRIDHSFLLVVRNPVEVAESLYERDSIPREQGALLWLVSVLNSEVATREERRSIVDFADVLDDWHTTLRPVVHRLFPPGRSIVVEQSVGDSIVDPDLRHHAFAAGPALSSEMGEWVQRAYRSLRELTMDEESITARKNLDELRREVASAGPLLRSSLPIVEGELRHELARMRCELLAQSDDVAAANSAVEELRQQVVELEGAAADHERAAAETAAVCLVLEDRSKRLEAIEASRSWRLIWGALAPYRAVRSALSRRRSWTAGRGPHPISVAEGVAE